MNKYGIKEFEQHLVALIEPLTKPGVLETHLKANLSASDVLRIALKVNQPSMADTARAILLERLWAKESSTSPYETLRLGESLGDKVIIGASYYRILLFGRSSWSSAPGLTSDDRRKLMTGMIKCGEEWQILFDALGSPHQGPKHPLIHRDCRSKNPSGVKASKTQRPVTGSLWDNLALRKLPWFDLMGKIDVMIKESPGWGCQPSCSTRYTSEVETIKNNLYLYFEAEQGITTE